MTNTYENVKRWRKANPDKFAKQQMRYQEKHKEELKAKRQARIRQSQHARLITLITEWIDGATLKELEDKYIVRMRPQRGE